MRLRERQRLPEATRTKRKAKMKNQRNQATAQDYMRLPRVASLMLRCDVYCWMW